MDFVLANNIPLFHTFLFKNGSKALKERWRFWVHCHIVNYCFIWLWPQPIFFESKHAYCRKTNKQSGPRRSIKIVPSNFHAEGKTPCKQTNVLRCVVGPSRKDYEEVGIETAEGEGEEEGYGDEFWVLLRGHWHPHVMCDAQERLAFGRLKLSGITCVQTSDAKNALEIVCCWASLPTIFAGWSWVLYQWYCTYSKFSFWTVRIHSS